MLCHLNSQKYFRKGNSGDLKQVNNFPSTQTLLLGEMNSFSKYDGILIFVNVLEIEDASPFKKFLT